MTDQNETPDFPEVLSTTYVCGCGTLQDAFDSAIASFSDALAGGACLHSIVADAAVVSLIGRMLTETDERLRERAESYIDVLMAEETVMAFAARLRDIMDARATEQKN